MWRSPDRKKRFSCIPKQYGKNLANQLMVHPNINCCRKCFWRILFVFSGEESISCMWIRKKGNMVEFRRGMLPSTWQKFPPSFRPFHENERSTRFDFHWCFRTLGLCESFLNRSFSTGQPIPFLDATLLKRHTGAYPDSTMLTPTFPPFDICEDSFFHNAPWMTQISKTSVSLALGKFTSQHKRRITVSVIWWFWRKFFMLFLIKLVSR